MRLDLRAFRYFQLVTQGVQQIARFRVPVTRGRDFLQRENLVSAWCNSTYLELSAVIGERTVVEPRERVPPSHRLEQNARPLRIRARAIDLPFHRGRVRTDHDVQRRV